MPDDPLEVVELRAALEAVPQVETRAPRPADELVGRNGVRVNGNEIRGSASRQAEARDIEGERIAAVMGVFDPSGVAYATTVIFRGELGARLE